MRRPLSRPLVALLAAVLAVGLGACGDVRERVDDARSSASDLGDRARFCLSVAQALTSLESGSERAAADAAEEALANAPEELEADARLIAQALREGRSLSDAEVQAAAERLAAGTRERCTGVG